MSAYVVFTRTKTIDQKELGKILDWNQSNDGGSSYRSARSLWKARSP